jgi:hypothetical protein
MHADSGSCSASLPYSPRHQTTRAPRSAVMYCIPLRQPTVTQRDPRPRRLQTLARCPRAWNDHRTHSEYGSRKRSPAYGLLDHTSSSAKRLNCPAFFAVGFLVFSGFPAAGVGRVPVVPLCVSMMRRTVSIAASSSLPAAARLPGTTLTSVDISVLSGGVGGLCDVHTVRPVGQRQSGCAEVRSCMLHAEGHTSQVLLRAAPE